VSAREALKHSYDDPVVQRNIDLDMNILDFYAREISKVEHFILAQARQHNPVFLNLLKTIPGVGRILSLTILYEIGDIDRFDSVQRFASYSRLVKCKAESAGKTAHKLGRCVYFMLKNRTVFDESKFLNG